MNVQDPPEDVTRHAQSVFKEMKIKVTPECQRHPGTAIGSKKFRQKLCSRTIGPVNQKGKSFVEKNSGVSFMHHIHDKPS